MSRGTWTEEAARNDVSDRIDISIPSDPRFRSVATLVLGGVGSRLDLPYERTDDLQLALLSILDATEGDEISIELEADGDGVAMSVGPLAPGGSSEPGLGLVLARLSDGVEASTRDGAEWVTVRLSRRPKTVRSR